MSPADAQVGEQVLPLVVQAVGGRPLSELIREKVSEPAWPDGTGLDDGRAVPDGFRDGVIVVGGSVLDSSAFEAVSFMTWRQATHSLISTPSDLLELLDAWVTGDLFTTDRAPAPDRFAPDPAGSPDFYGGVGVPDQRILPVHRR